MSQPSNGLARAVAAEQSDDRPRLDLEADPVESKMIAVAAGLAGYRDSWRHTVTPPCALSGSACVVSLTSATSSSVPMPSPAAPSRHGAVLPLTFTHGLRVVRR